MTTKEKIEVMQAFEDGKEIEYSHNDKWFRSTNPDWNFSARGYRIKPKPEPATLEDRIKAKYPDYEVAMLEWCQDIWSLDYGCFTSTTKPHIDAQSMRGFYIYVYESEDKELYASVGPVDWQSTEGRKIIHPVAVLFNK